MFRRSNSWIYLHPIILDGHLMIYEVIVEGIRRLSLAFILVSNEAFVTLTMWVILYCLHWMTAPTRQRLHRWPQEWQAVGEVLPASHTTEPLEMELIYANLI